MVRLRVLGANRSCSKDLLEETGSALPLVVSLSSAYLARYGKMAGTYLLLQVIYLRGRRRQLLNLAELGNGRD